MTRTLRLTAAVAAAGLTLAGCSGSDDQPAESPATGVADESTTTNDEGAADEATEGSSGDPTEQRADGSAEAGVDPANPPEPIATVEMPARGGGNTEATVKVDLLDLRREDKLLVMTVGFTPEQEEGEGEPQNLFQWLGSKSWSPQVVDSTNLTIHDVVAAEGSVGGQGEVKTAVVGNRFAPGQTQYGVAVFAAPPAGATLSIKVTDGAPPINGVKAP